MNFGLQCQNVPQILLIVVGTLPKPKPHPKRSWKVGYFHVEGGKCRGLAGWRRGSRRKIRWRFLDGDRGCGRKEIKTVAVGMAYKGCSGESRNDELDDSFRFGNLREYKALKIKPLAPHVQKYSVMSGGIRKNGKPDESKTRNKSPKSPATVLLPRRTQKYTLYYIYICTTLSYVDYVIGVCVCVWWGRVRIREKVIFKFIGQRVCNFGIVIVRNRPETSE